MEKLFGDRAGYYSTIKRAKIKFYDNVKLTLALNSNTINLWVENQIPKASNAEIHSPPN